MSLSFYNGGPLARNILEQAGYRRKGEIEIKSRNTILSCLPPYYRTGVGRESQRFEAANLSSFTPLSIASTEAISLCVHSGTGHVPSVCRPHS
jgi:hypothetical protein